MWLSYLENEEKIVKPIDSSRNPWFFYKNKKFKSWVILDPSGPVWMALVWHYKADKGTTVATGLTFGPVVC